MPDEWFSGDAVTRALPQLMKTKNNRTKRTHPTPDQIATRAYEIWETSGRPEGCDMDHWLQAEAEILASGNVMKAAA